MLRRLLLAAMAALMTLLSLPAATPAAAQDGRLVWDTVAGVPADTTLTDVTMTSAESAWAVGWSRTTTSGLVYRLSLVGGRWQAALDATLAAPLEAVAATSDANVWAVGHDIAAQRTAQGWRTVALPYEQLNLYDIQLLGDGREAYAVGSRFLSESSEAVALRYVDDRWQPLAVESPRLQVLRALHLGGGGAWAVGSGVWRLRDGAWQREALPDLCGGAACFVEISDIRAIDAERAIAVGQRGGGCAVCPTRSIVLARDSAGWRDPLAPNTVASLLPAVGPGFDTHYLTSLFTTGASQGLAVGYRNYQQADGGYTADLFGLRYRDGVWGYELIRGRTPQTPLALFMLDAGRALLVGGDGLIMSYGYGPQSPPAGPRPTDRVANPALPGVLYFNETGHTLRGAFRSYWERNGGLAQFGYPISEEFREQNDADGQTYAVQYFERARFEYHPELAGTRYEVLLGLLGHTITAGRKAEAPFRSSQPTGIPGGRYFSETGHTMAPQFVTYWDRNGGLPVYGYPISEAFYELNPEDGKTYLVQYFERNRFEYHPELAGTRYEVLLGLLGNQVLRDRGWLR